MLGNPAHEWIDFTRDLERELTKCRASLGAIHYHASRGSIEWPRVILLSIKEEAEHCIPELANILSNTSRQESMPGAGVEATEGNESK